MNYHNGCSGKFKGFRTIRRTCRIKLSFVALPCDREGNQPTGDFESRPQSSESDESNPWFPFRSRTEFKLANFLYRKVQMSQTNIDELMDYWAETLLDHDGEPPFADHNDLFSVIDEIKHGDAPWSSFSVSYDGDVPEQNVPSWMKKEYEVWYRDPRTVAHNILKNPAFKESFDYVPFQEYDASGKRRLQNLMSANWAWRQADKIIAEDSTNKGSMFVPIILGSDKTTVSVATGQNEYYPLYMSIGNLSNSARRAHCESVIPIGFLAIPKGAFLQ
ncbi:hypothetical protein K474DRAFT_1609307 [Panus rudis PR-1116 ss-1]|nr:hypothetical protein K474DRAFT_1609307 [Panus rudis PR-1116 ss-1]